MIVLVTLGSIGSAAAQGIPSEEKAPSTLVSLRPPAEKAPNRTNALLIDGVLVACGLGLGGAGVAQIVMAGPPVNVGERPDPLDYVEWTQWREATDGWETRLAKADARDEHLWIGATLITAGAFAGALVPLTGREAALQSRGDLAPAVAVGPTEVRLTWVIR